MEDRCGRLCKAFHKADNWTDGQYSRATGSRYVTRRSLPQIFHGRHARSWPMAAVAGAMGDMNLTFAARGNRSFLSKH